MPALNENELELLAADLRALVYEGRRVIKSNKTELIIVRLELRKARQEIRNLQERVRALEP